VGHHRRHHLDQEVEGLAGGIGKRRVGVLAVAVRDFGKGGGEKLAADLSVPFLGRVALYEPIRMGGDTGVPITIAEPQSAPAEAFRSAARQLAAQLSIASYKKTAIPLIPIA